MTIAELRRIRMAKGLSLTEISRRTRIGVGFLRKIEEGNLQALPPGFYARAFVRAYSEAIGIDADVVLGTLAAELPAPQAATAPHPSATQDGTVAQRVASAEMIPDARMHLLKKILDRHNTLVNETVGRSSIAALGAAVAPSRRFLSASIDGLLLASLYLSVLALTAFSCGVTVSQLIAASGFAVFTVLALITLLYVFMMGGIAGRYHRSDAARRAAGGASGRTAEPWRDPPPQPALRACRRGRRGRGGVAGGAAVPPHTPSGIERTRQRGFCRSILLL